MHDLCTVMWLVSVDHVEMEHVLFVIGQFCCDVIGCGGLKVIVQLNIVGIDLVIEAYVASECSIETHELGGIAELLLLLLLCYVVP